MFKVFFVVSTFCTTQYGRFVGVIPSAFLRVGENFVGCLDLGEFPCGFFFCTIVAIRVQVEGSAAIGFFDSAKPC